MTIVTPVNHWAVLVAGVVYFILGAVWYSKGVFGKVWMQGIGKTPEQVNAAFSPWKLVWTFLCSLVAAYGIARILSFTTPSGCTGLLIGLLAGVCFVLTVMSLNDVMEGRPLKLTVTNVLYHIVGFLLMGVIIGVWR